MLPVKVEAQRLLVALVADKDLKSGAVPGLEKSPRGVILAPAKQKKRLGLAVEASLQAGNAQVGAGYRLDVDFQVAAIEGQGEAGFALGKKGV